METEDAKSEVLNISTGVPQGLILDPLLFIICINDIAKASQKFNFIMYADDTTLKYTRFFPCVNKMEMQNFLLILN